MASRLPIAPEQARRFVEILPEMSWDYPGAYAKVTGMKPGKPATRKAAAAFLSHPGVARMIRSRWGVAPDSKMAEGEAQALLRAIVYADATNYMVINNGAARYMRLEEFQALPQAMRLCLDNVSLQADGTIRFDIPRRLESIKLLASISGLMNEDGDANVVKTAAAVVNAFVAAAERARELTAQAIQTRTAKQLMVPGAAGADVIDV